VRVFGALVGKLKAAGVPEHVWVSLKTELGRGGFRRDVPSCLLLGLRHGAYCVGCCWALMVLLFVGGVMNLFWVVVLSLLIFLEKVTFLGRQIAPLAGIILIAAGAWLLSMGMS
jgi:predicted metal-binding membrane protein